ncbi:cell division control protein [Cryptococcus wingfieldii CBS 7118]|uniref:Cell division control protein n=1 Tax=Cryptococcus wingfieldii CBS 7118 TaxID=1295528 RepID=A0A1E3I1J6_9TREE|nr:cell division control protein [Cryptococcus wingfieldii CBS 7118]ODN82493.1 cell division control protein [Cryptococcus wingfieldii CBS 7118]
MLSENSSNLPADTSNPFMSKSPLSPPKSRVSPDSSLASLRQGMGRMDISSKGSSVPYMTETRERKESKDTTRRELDRFVPSRPASLAHSSHSGSAMPTLAMDAATPDGSMDTSLSGAHDQSTSSLQASLGINNGNRRILSFRAPPPPSSRATSHLDAQRNYLLQSNASANRGGSTASGKETKKRAPPYMPERVLDAPGFQDDYYLNLIDWSCANRVAIGLGDLGYVWDAETGDVSALGSGVADEEEPNPVTAVSWSNDGAYLALGLDSGEIQIWDVEENKKMRTMKGHQARIPTLDWHGHVLTSGCRDGSIYHHDVRVAKHKVQELVGHNAEVCGLAWRPDGQFLASGGNDNVVNCWDGRIGASVLQTDEGTPRGVAKWTKRNHTAAVKAIAWCPWQSSLLATGGGTADKHVHFWSTSTGARTASLSTSTQVTSLTFSPHSKEILGTHGYPDNTLTLWSYPGLEKVWEVPAHDSRIISSALSPDGTTLCTGAGDENLKFWKVWEPKAVKKDRDEGESGGGRGKTAVRIR